MTYRTIRHAILLLLTSAAFVANLSAATIGQSFASYVDPRIGTGDHGHVFLGANVPFGMINAGPSQIESGWDWCSGYHESGTKIVGFAQLHLSGTGCSDLGDISIMPVAQDGLTLSREGLAHPYCHDNETVRPGYYSVLLGTDQPVAVAEASQYIRVEVTADARNAQYRITFPEGASRNDVVVNLKDGIDDQLRHASCEQVSPTTIVGYRISHGWAYEQHCFFALRSSRPFKSFAAGERHQYNTLSFEASTEPLEITISLSPVSEFNAMRNLLPVGTSFDEVRAAADAAWNHALGRVDASFQNDRDRTIFYTALYHFMVAPQLWDDANGDWRGADNRVYRSGLTWTKDEGWEKGESFFADNRPHYLTTLSLWDTYRAAAPLGTIIMPEMMPSVAETYLRIFREQGKLPVWHLMSQETNCMVGCPAVPVLADLLLKGYVRDTTAAWQAITASLLMDERGLDDMKQYGYVASDHQGESLSKTLEYMLADWAAAQAGNAIAACGKNAEAVQRCADYFEQRSQGYKKLYDHRVGFLRSLDSRGEFCPLEGFNPAHQTRDYTEGNPWQYLWLVPHDVDGLVAMIGGREKACQRLDSLFVADSQLNAEAQPDITGLIGQYAHGNEPSHHIAYLYALMGQPRKTAKLVHQIQRELYTDQPAGLCGNEDVGQMSAWYILSALGFYQVEPCGGRYVIGSPLIKEATLHVGEGKTFKIRTHGLSEQAIYVKRVLLNGQPLPPIHTLSHEAVLQTSTQGSVASTQGSAASTQGSAASTQGSAEKLPKGFSAPFILRHEDIMEGGTLDVYMTK